MSYAQIRLLDDVVRKTECKPHPGKRNSLDREAEIIAELNGLHCPCVPRLLRRGRDPEGRPFLELERIRSIGAPRLEDAWLSYLAVRGLGWVHGDLLRRNTLFDGDIAWLIDFDQADRVSGTVAEDLTRGFIDPEWRQALAELSKAKLDLGRTSLALNGCSTNGHGGIYHALDEEHVFIQGERSLAARLPVLDQIRFDGEIVLDVGCNTGALTRYIARRAARQVHGLEICRTHAILGQMVNCITCTRNARIFYGDISRLHIGQYDTICLFSVLQHIEDLQFAREQCGIARRLLIETRLVESGGKYDPKQGWLPTQQWAYDRWEGLIAWLERLFPDFQFNRDYGCGDRKRHILEFVRR